MKKLISIFLIFCSIITLDSVIASKANAQSVTFQAFYDDLTPYGTWFENPDYGYVWRPSMSSGFAPYSSNGHWVLTDAGWTWISDYSWGWAPFHYGRWFNDPSYGYVWVPGYEWGPGWVSWRRSNDYYGWAPIGPGVDINIAYGSGYSLPYNQWNFVRCRDFGRRDLNNYYINRSRNVTVINNTTVINNVYVDRTRNTRYNLGPDRSEVQKVVGRPVQPVAIRDQAKPAQHVNNGTVQLYRPKVLNIQDAPVKPVPSRVTPINDVKPIAAAPVKAEPRPTRSPAPISSAPQKPQPAQQPTPVIKNPGATINNQPVRNPGIRNTPGVKQPGRETAELQVQPEIQQPSPSSPTRTPREINNQPQQSPVRKNTDRNSQQRPDAKPPVQTSRPVQQQPPVQRNIQPRPVMPQRQPENIQRSPVPVRQQPMRQAPAPRPVSPAMPNGGRKAAHM